MTEAKEQAEAPPQEKRPYHWFQGESVRRLYDELTEYGPDRARLEVHQRNGRMTFRVCGPGEDDGDPINKSHICPPDCP